MPLSAILSTLTSAQLIAFIPSKTRPNSQRLPSCVWTRPLRRLGRSRSSLCVSDSMHALDDRAEDKKEFVETNTASVLQEVGRLRPTS